MKKLSPSFSLLTIELYNTSIEYIDTETEDNLKDLGCVISIWIRETIIHSEWRNLGIN